MCVEGRAEELEFPPCFSPALLLQCSASLAPVPEDSGRQMPQHGSLISHFSLCLSKADAFQIVNEHPQTSIDIC